MKYQAHINVEACMSVKAVKYLCKYLNKGHDGENIEINEQINHDEVNAFLDCRYVVIFASKRSNILGECAYSCCIDFEMFHEACPLKGDFSQWLLKLGSGKIPVKEEDPFKVCIEIPHQCIIRENVFIFNKIFGNAEQNDYSKRVILTPTNVDSLSINEEVLECLPGEVKIYLSADQIETDDLNERNNFHVEFWNSLTSLGMPPHFLKFKIGCVIMLLRDLDHKTGLCNGTRMKVCALQNNFSDAEVSTGASGGKRVFVPRIQLAPSDSNVLFVLKRRQFPVRLAYSMKINKIQD
ncbi:uncharacterized protein LOC136074673 [Hydra vulgaris]|uniref:Uncharacterized protein LOC136074673 n=1 Tax=Hydra vulgaris TaxID=6087 RepID=A0ABM4B2P7_HYDVU